MKPRSILPFGFAFCVGFLSANAAISQAPAPAPIPAPVLTFEYVAKYVCGRAGGQNFPVATGQYYTAINVHNATEGVDFRKKFVVALPGEKQGGFISPWYGASLKYDEAFEIDCPDILSRAHPPGTPVPAFAKGFVVIQSPRELDIVAVYTAAASPTGPVVAMDVERVPKR